MGRASTTGGAAPWRDRRSWASTTAPRLLNKTNAKNEAGGAFSCSPFPRQPRSPSSFAHRHHHHHQQQQQQRRDFQHYHLRPFVGCSREGASSPISAVVVAAAAAAKGATASAAAVVSATSTVTAAGTASSAARRTAASAAAVARLGNDTRRTARGVHAGYTMGKQSRVRQSSGVTRRVQHRAGGGRHDAPGASFGAARTKMTAGNTAGNTAGTSAGGAAAGAAVGGAGTKQQLSREPLLRGFDTTLRGARGWTPAHAKLNEHPFMITPRTFRVPVLGVSVKLSLMETMVNVEGKSGTRRPYEELFGHLSFVLLGAAYLTRDVITLRCVAVGGLSAAVVFQYFRPAPLWLPLRWNLLFVGINAVWVGRLWWEEHLAHLEITEEERELQRKHFSHMPERDFWHLLHCGEWVELPAGAELTREGESPRRVYAVTEGSARVEVRGKKLNVIRAGEFIGEMSLMKAIHPSRDGAAGGSRQRSSSSSSSPSSKNPFPDGGGGGGGISSGGGGGGGGGGGQDMVSQGKGLMTSIGGGGRAAAFVAPLAAATVVAENPMRCYAFNHDALLRHFDREPGALAAVTVAFATSLVGKLDGVRAHSHNLAVPSAREGGQGVKSSQ